MRMLISIATLGVIAAAAADAQIFYIANGKPVPLETSKVFRAYRLPKERADAVDVDVFKQSLKSVSALSVANLPVSEKRGIIAFRIDQSGVKFNAALFDAAVAAAGLDPREKVPAYNVGGVELFLQNRFLIRFEEDIDPVTARKFIREVLGVAFEPEPQNKTGHFTVSFPEDTDIFYALDVINSLNGRSPVWYAEPLFIRTYPPRGSPRGGADRKDEPKQDVRGAGGSDGVACEAPTPSATPPEDTYLRNQWALKNDGTNPLPGIDGADIGWSAISGDHDVKIAVVDLGVEMDHPDLKNKIVAGCKEIGEGNAGAKCDITGEADANPKFLRDYHGTAVAGLAAAEANNGQGIAGVAPLAQIIPIRVGSTNDEEGGWQTDDGWEAQAISTAVELGARVIINAWQTDGTGATSTNFTQAVATAVEEGAVIVFPAGNHQEQAVNGLFEVTPGVTWPATHVDVVQGTSVHDGLIVVSATNHRDELKTPLHQTTNCIVPPALAGPGFQCTNCQQGPSHMVDHFLVGSNYGPQVSLAAPGYRVCSTDTGSSYSYFGDTSAAAAIVGGAAAVLFSLHPTATPAEVKSWLVNNAADLCPDKVDDYTGSGRLDLERAIAAARVKVQIYVERADDRIKKGEERWVRAKVSRQGATIADMPVTFAVSSRLELVSGATITTDASGVAEATIRGNSRWRRTEGVKVRADDGVDSAAVRVPGLPPWSIGLIALLILAASRLRASDDRA